MSALKRLTLIALLTLGPIIPVFADEIYDWSTTAANNNSAPPDGFPENMNYSEVNDAARELMVKQYLRETDGIRIDISCSPRP